MDRAGKEELVSQFSNVFTDKAMIVVTHYSGLSVEQLTRLRGDMAEVGGNFKITKNRIVKLALEGTSAQPISDLFSGPTAIAYSDDPAGMPKILANFAKENENLIILGGMMGEEVLDANGIKILASLPSLDELRGKIIGVLSAPAGKLAAIMQAPAGKVARVVGAHASKGDNA